MGIITVLLDYLFKPQGPQSFYVERILGYFILMIAAGVGLFFLFQALIPVVGYIESGLIIFVILIFTGFGLLYLSQNKRRERPIDTLLNQVQQNLKGSELNLDQVISKNIPKILISCFVAGITLSEVLNFIKENKNNK